MVRKRPAPTKRNIIKFREALAFVESFSNVSFRKKRGRQKQDPEIFIRRARWFLNLIGSPDKKFQFIHIAGTAGKGTVSTMIHNALTSEGKRVGLFTSPHATTAIEKIRVNDLYISPRAFTHLLNFLKPLIAETAKSSVGKLSAFEIFLAIALLYFQKMRCDWVILEAGLGGRYDATNAIGSPRVAVITNVDFGHTEILGKTLTEIARDKGGIIKKDSFFLTAETRPRLLAIFRSLCRAKGAKFVEVHERGNYQSKNFALARKVAQIIGMSEKSIERGLKGAILPARFEQMSQTPMIILDGAHNRVKMRSVVTNLRELKYQKLFLMLAMANADRDSAAAIKIIAPLADEIVLTSFSRSGQRAIHPRVILPTVKHFKRKKVKVGVFKDMNEALRYLLVRSGSDDCVLVTGSFFLAGQIRERWFPEEWVLQNRKSFR